MEISQLLSFHEIVKTGSYSKASKNLFITQSAVSHQIKNLESELGIKLFERVGNLVKLTEAGTILSGAVLAFLDELDNLKRISVDIHHSKAAHLTIATTSAMSLYILPGLIKNLIKKLPGVKVKVIIRSLITELLPMVSNAEIDLAVGPQCDQTLLPNTFFSFWKSFDRILLMGKDHPLSKKKIIGLNDISAHPLISYREGSVTRKSIEETFCRDKLSYKIIMEADDAENIKEYVEMGLGVAILSSFTLTPKDKSRFRSLNVNCFFGKVDYGIYYRKNKYVTEVMRQFIKFIIPEFSDNVNQMKPGQTSI